MARLEHSALILLAAGLSRRFGEADKLAAMLDGKPLAHHAADRLGALPFAQKLVVTGDAGLAFPGWQPVVNADPAAGQGRSLALGVAAAQAAGAEAVVIALADMPMVTADHVRALFAALDGRGRVGSLGPGGAMPPALFTAARFPALMVLSGDRGARGMLADAVLVPAPPETLADVDTPAALAAIRDAARRSD